MGGKEVYWLIAGVIYILVCNTRATSLDAEENHNPHKQLELHIKQKRSQDVSEILTPDGFSKNDEQESIGVPTNQAAEYEDPLYFDIAHPPLEDISAYDELSRHARECPYVRRLKEYQARQQAHRFQSQNQKPTRPLQFINDYDYRNKRNTENIEKILYDLQKETQQNTELPLASVKKFDAFNQNSNQQRKVHDSTSSDFDKNADHKSLDEKSENEANASIERHKRSLNQNLNKEPHMNNLVKRSVDDIEEDENKNTKQISYSKDSVCCQRQKNKRSVSLNVEEDIEKRKDKMKRSTDVDSKNDDRSITCCGNKANSKPIAKRSVIPQSFNKITEDDNKIHEHAIDLFNENFHSKLKTATEKCKPFLGPELRSMIQADKSMLMHQKSQNTKKHQRSKRRVNYLWENPTYEKLDIYPEWDECIKSIYDVPGFTESGFDWQILGDHFRYFYAEMKDLAESYGLGLYAAIREMTAMHRFMKEGKIRGPYESGPFTPYYYAQRRKDGKPSYKDYVGPAVYGRKHNYYDGPPYVPPPEDRYVLTDEKPTKE